VVWHPAVVRYKSVDEVLEPVFRGSARVSERVLGRLGLTAAEGEERLPCLPPQRDLGVRRVFALAALAGATRA
jgi:hypothetical protein